MNKSDFISNLNNNNLNKLQKIETCQFFIDNYPVCMQSINPFTGQIQHNWTSLHGVKLSGGSDEIVDFAYNSLVSRKSELEKF